MPESSRAGRRSWSWSAIAAVALCAALVAIGTVVWFVPFLTSSRGARVSTAAPPALSAIAPVVLTHGQQACMSSVTIPDNSGLMQFLARPGNPAQALNPTVEVDFSGAGGYRSRTLVRNGPPGVQTQPLTPPHQTLIGQVCFVDRGASPLLMLGSDEPRTATRSKLTVDGKQAPGELMLLLFKAQATPILERLDEIFTHASNLTEGLVPVWLVWIVAVLVAFGMPVALLAAFYLAMREDAVRSERSARAAPARRQRTA